MIVKLTRLTSADIYRDGGSYEARFETEDATGFGLWLQRSAMPDEQGLHHRWLYAYSGYVRPAGAVPVVTGSDEERQLLEALDEFMSRSEALGTPVRALQRLTEMVTYIRRREPCFPADLRVAGFLR